MLKFQLKYRYQIQGNKYDDYELVNSYLNLKICIVKIIKRYNLAENHHVSFKLKVEML